MKNIHVKIAVIGGGPAGLAAALGAESAGIRAQDILIIERDKYLGGILNQCIHAGFGLTRFSEELTGPEYAQRYCDMVLSKNIPFVTEAMVVSVTKNKEVYYMSEKEGMVKVSACAIILAMGCRERPRGAINIPGTRPAGIFTAGTVQKYVNIDGFMPGKNAVILGSGDIGLIMARRLTLEGANVKAVCEIMPYSSGLSRNIAQCLDDFKIPLLLSHTVVKTLGDERITGVIISKVDETLCPIPGTEEYIECDMLVLSVGLIPENDLSTKLCEIDSVTKGPVVDNFRQTTAEGIFACGNVLHVHDLVDFVSNESRLAGISAANYILNPINTEFKGKVLPSGGVRYIVPQYFCPQTIDENTEFFFRVGKPFKNCTLTVSNSKKVIFTKKLLRAFPGEMEHISFKGESLEEVQHSEELIFCIENKTEA